AFYLLAVRSIKGASDCGGGLVRSPFFSGRCIMLRNASIRVAKRVSQVGFGLVAMPRATNYLAP
ncbi:hypothetical protein, partial [Paraburkholderia hospita]|uniref:hypothetical protein n=1 Tax=Paraburkholderia hospita TaxID=169430 RepID=UPI001A99BC7B